jgi:hypothetical protein
MKFSTIKTYHVSHFSDCPAYSSDHDSMELLAIRNPSFTPFPALLKGGGYISSTNVSGNSCPDSFGNRTSEQKVLLEQRQK